MPCIRVFQNLFSVISIYVSHNSDKYIKRFGGRHHAELGSKTFLINSCEKTSGLEGFPTFDIINIGKNIGFSAANNMAISAGLKLEPGYFLIINPDVYLPPSWLSNVFHEIDQLSRDDVGIYTVPLFSYDFCEDEPTGLIDSLGISHTWYGRWYDVLQGANVSQFDKSVPPYEIQAACGALMLISRGTINCLLEEDGYVFNESYFMYKEDIELSLRVSRLGKKILMLPSVPAFHCRGWAKERGDSSYWARSLSARNELKMHMDYYWRHVPYSLLKYVYVKTFERIVMRLTGKK